MNGDPDLNRLIEDACADLRQGNMVVIVDDEGRENEGDLILAAEFATQETINFMARYGRGLICLALPPERVDALELGPMSLHNTAHFGTAFTVSIEARTGITTGISAGDRAITIQAAINPHTLPSDLARPGHVFPIRAAAGGVLERPGHTEAAVDMVRLAGLFPAAVLCAVMNEDGTMARLPELRAFCLKHGLRLVAVHDLVQHRNRALQFVR